MDRLRPSARWKGITKEKTPVACRACRGRSRGARRCFKRSSGFARHAAKKNVPRFLLEKIPKETGERSFLGGMVSEPEFRRRRTMRVAWLIQRVHENHAARTMGSSDRDIISIRWPLVGAALRRKVRPRARQPPACQVSATEEGEKTSLGDFQPRHLRGLELRRSTTD